MALINRFADPAEERAYVTGERGSHVKALKIIIAIIIAMMFVYLALTPFFFSSEVTAIYNGLMLVLMVAFAVAYYVCGTRYYLEWLWLDFLSYLFVTVVMTIMLLILADTEETTGTTFLGLAVINLAISFVFASIAFIANVRIFLISVLGLMAVYVVYIVIVDIPIFPKVFMVANVSMFLSFALFSNWDTDRRARAKFAVDRELETEKQKTEELLYNVLPQAVAKRLRAGEAVADSFSDVSVIFVDIVGFSRLAKQLSPGHLVEELNRFFSIADICAERYGVEKVKTIGDAYLAVSGGTASSGHGARDAINFGRDLIIEMKERAKASGVDIKLRVGIHTGPVVGGVVGSSRLAYDYWGDTMNIASRIEGAAEPNGIAVSSSTYFQCTDCHEFGKPETLTLKGVGDTEVYRLVIQ